MAAVANDQLRWVFRQKDGVVGGGGSSSTDRMGIARQIDDESHSV